MADLPASPYKKTQAQAPSLTPSGHAVTACEWLLQQINASSSSLLTDEKNLEQRWLLFLAPTFPITLLGEHANNFMKHAPVLAQKEEWGGPLMLQKIESVATVFSLLDKDLTEDPLWQTYWDKFTAQYPLEKSTLLQKQLLGAYRLRVIQECTLLNPQDIPLEEQPFRAIPICEFLHYTNYYLSQLSAKGCYEFLLSSSSKWLKEQKENALTSAKKAIKQGDFTGAHLLLQREWLTLHLSRSFGWLGSEMGGKILFPLQERSQYYANVVNFIEELLVLVCAQALPGNNIESLIRQEIDKIKRTHPFKPIPEVGPVAVARYLNSPAILRTIYEKVLAARVGYYLPLISKNEDDYALLRRELKKITVYRSRRDIIAQLYQWVLKQNDIPQLQELNQRDACLIMLQGEYLQAINRELEQMNHQSALMFLEHCRTDPILQPLPRARWFQLKKDIAQRELAMLIKSVHLLPSQKPKEDVPLHNIDSSIEMNILGELTKELTEAAGAEHDELEDFSIIIDVLRKSQNQIQDPCFRPEPLLSEWVILENKSEWVKDKLLALEPQARQEQLILLYKILKEQMANTPTKHKLLGGKPPLAKIKQMLESLFLITIEEQIKVWPCTTPRDQYILYYGLLMPARQTPFLMGEGANDSALHARWQQLVHDIRTRPVSPIPLS